MQNIGRLMMAAMAAFLSIVSAASADNFGAGANAFTIDFVPISGDTNSTSGWGIVNNDYRMGTYEITNDQWNKFKASLGVPVTGAPLSAYNQSPYDQYPYFTGTNVPTNRVSWYEAAQFVNWLNTSKGHQAAYKFTGTQGTLGYYHLAIWSTAEADNVHDGTNLYRHKDAMYYMPTEHEWIKAAYWNGTALQTYATKPGDTLHQGDGVSGTGWNYYDGDYVDPYGPWDVGSGSEELNGTFDMMGNVYEWMESPYYNGAYETTSSRGFRGGCYGYIEGPFPLTSSCRDDHAPDYEDHICGFRVASEPYEDLDLDGVADRNDLCADTAPLDPVDGCGCSDLQVDSDGDTICDPGAPCGGPSGCTGTDNCPDDPNKTDPGQCGCGMLDANADEDEDGVDDACDECPNTIPGIDVDDVGCPPLIPGDLDRDGDVDQSDFGIFQRCSSGPNVPGDPNCAD